MRYRTGPFRITPVIELFLTRDWRETECPTSPAMVGMSHPHQSAKTPTTDQPADAAVPWRIPAV
jgi:hypothetical protein